VRAGRVLTFYKWEGRGWAHAEAEPGSLGGLGRTRWGPRAQPRKKQ
jgi:hypothetical protein